MLQKLFWKILEQNHSITDGSWDFCEMTNCFKERIQAAASEIIWESWLQLQHIDARDSVNKAIYLSTEATLVIY